MMLIILRGDFVPHRAFKLFRCQESSPTFPDDGRWISLLLTEKFPVRRSREFFSQGAVSSSKIVVMQLLAYAYFREVTVFFAVIGNSNDRDGFAGGYVPHHALRRCGDFLTTSKKPAIGGNLIGVFVSAANVRSATAASRPEFSGVEFVFPGKRRLGGQRPVRTVWVKGINDRGLFP